MQHAVPAYLEWWRAYLVLSHGCSQLMLKSMQQVLDASVATLVYRPSLPVMPVRLPALAGTAWVWPMNMAAYHSSRLPLLAGASLLRRRAATENSPEIQRVMAQVIRLVASPRQ
ncbi:MAG: hypothetical protein RL210_1999 [Pseudomonadota bacterium]